MQNRIKELPVRKNIRLKGYDYSGNGCYFITICIKDRYKILGKIVVGEGSALPQMKLSDYGKIVQT